MSKGEKNNEPPSRLAMRGLTIKPCPLGTGILIEQSEGESPAFNAHLSISEAKELVTSLVQQIQHTQTHTIETLTSLYAKGYRIDQIAHHFDLTEKAVRAALKQKGYLKEDSP